MISLIDIVKLQISRCSFFYILFVLYDKQGWRTHSWPLQPILSWGCFDFSKLFEYKYLKIIDLLKLIIFVHTVLYIILGCTADYNFNNSYAK